MSTTTKTTTGRPRDPLLVESTTGRLSPPDRVRYAEGVLLDAEDFTDEQTYHRGRLARMLAQLHGSGTVVGLRVSWENGLSEEEDPELTQGRAERLRVMPGLAVDRLGRMIELPRAVCLALNDWYAAQTVDALRDSLSAAPAGRITADVFVAFHPCERGKTPAFSTGPYHAADAVVPARIRDAWRLELVLRTEPDPPLPVGPWSSLPSVSPLTELHEALLDAWRDESASGGERLPPAAEHPRDETFDTSSIFLARVGIPATGDPDPTKAPSRTEGATVSVDNLSRLFVHPCSVIARRTGL